MTTKCDVEEQVRLEVQRLDSLFEPHFRRGITGDVRATLVCLKVMERRARLLGLDAPARHPVAVEPSGGVLVVPGMMEEESWLAAVKVQQEELLRMEAEIWQRPPARPRRVVVDD
jgi:hypothetical protein